MGKRTRGSELPVLGILFIAGGFYAATAAAQPVIQIGTGSGSPNGTATFSVTLNAGGASVAATENDISFDATKIPINTIAAGKGCEITRSQVCTTDADCPDLPAPFTGKEACVDQPAAPDCTVNPAIGKQGFFSFPQAGTMRALILAVNNLSAIPDGSTLYTCNIAIPSSTAFGDYALTNGNESAGDPSQALIAGVTGTDNTITVTQPTGVSFVVCDVFPVPGAGGAPFGDSNVRNADIKSLLTMLGSPVTTDILRAADAFGVDNPPQCGGDGNIRNADVKTCLTYLGGKSFVRTLSDSTCSSAAQQ